MKKGGKILNKIANVILDILIGIFLIVLVISLYRDVQTKILKNSYSEFFGYSIFEVQTGSMANTINISDWIVVKKKSEIKLGDIITYEKDGEFITHRVVEKYKGTYITKGDANNAKDDPVSQEQIVGTVVKILPNFGIIRKTIFNPVILIMLIVTIYLFNLSFRKKNKDAEKSGLSKKIDTLFEKIIDKVIKNLDNKQAEKNKNTKIKKDDSMVSFDDMKDDTADVTLIDIKNDKKEEDKTVEEKLDEALDEKDNEVEYEQVAGKPIEKEELEKFDVGDNLSEEDYDKTMYYRAVKVDVSELDDTFAQITQNQEAIDEEERKAAEKLAAKNVKIDEPEDEEVDESLIKNQLEMLKEKDKRKFNNIIDRVMYLKGKEIEEILETLNDGKKLLTNEASIRNSMLKSYIDARYYNYCGDANAEFNGKNMVSKVSNLLFNIASSMTKAYKGSDSKYGEKTVKYANLYSIVLNLEQTYASDKTVDELREAYMHKLSRYFKDENLVEKRELEIINEIIKTQRIFNASIKYVIKRLETDVFELDYNQLASNKKMYGLDLKHKIAFSKVYSDYIVDKTYSEGIIAEDKILVLISLLSSKVVQDVMAGNFNDKYIFSMPGSMFEKDNKLGQFVKATENEYLKNIIYILVDYETLTSNKKVIKDLKKSGYKFALVFNETVNVEAKNQSIINVVDIIYIDKKQVDAASIISTLPEDVKKHVVNEDIEIKVGNYGGE